VSIPFYNPQWYSQYSYAAACPYAPFMNYSYGVYPGVGYRPDNGVYENYYWYGPRYRVRTTYVAP
jgi:hypothetical protein